MSACADCTTARSSSPSSGTRWLPSPYEPRRRAPGSTLACSCSTGTPTPAARPGGTRAAGPWRDDVLFVLEGDDDRGVVIGSEVATPLGLLPRLQALPDF